MEHILHNMASNYIASVDGNAHNSAVELLTAAETEIARLTAEVERLSQPCEWSACMRRKPTQAQGE